MSRERLIALRREHPALARGDFETLTVFNAIYAYHRCLDADSVVVVLNPREARQNVRIPLGSAAGRAGAWRDVLSGECFPVEDGRLVLETLPARAGCVLLPLGGPHD